MFLKGVSHLTSKLSGLRFIILALLISSSIFAFQSIWTENSDAQSIFEQSPNHQDPTKGELLALLQKMGKYTPVDSALRMDADDCPEIQVIELQGVPGFSETNELVICGSSDTLAYLIFIEEPGNISGTKMTLNFDPGMQYAGFEHTKYDETTISNVNPNPAKPVFLLEGITDGVFIAYVGVESNCDADINITTFEVDIDLDFIYEDTDGNFQKCRQSITPDRVYNSTIKEPVLNFRNSPITTISALNREYCTSINISQDGLNAYVTDMDFSICNLDLNSDLLLNRILISGTEIPYTYDSVALTASIEVNGSNFTNGQLNESEQVSISVCYQINDCPVENTQFIQYKASYGCNDEICQQILKESEIRVRPNSRPEAYAEINRVGDPGVCGAPSVINVLMYAVNSNTTNAVQDSALGLFTDLAIGFETCEKTSLDITRVTIGTTELTPDQFNWVNEDLVIDFTSLEVDPDGDGGLTDADGDGFFDDLPGDQQLALSFELSFVCELPADPTTLACSSVDCSFSKFFVTAKRDCGQAFTFLPEIEEFNIVNGANYVEMIGQDQINTSTVGYDFGVVGNFNNCSPRDAQFKDVEFCYTYTRENVSPCPDANATNTLQVIFEGSPLIVQDVQFVAGSGSITVDGATVQSGINGVFTDIDQSTRVLSIPAGDIAVDQVVCYKYQLEADTAACSPPVYMVGTHQVIETCTTADCTCQTIKACESALFRSDPADCGCTCDISSGGITTRWNAGYTDESATTQLDREDIPAIDRNRFLPCDTMYYKGWMALNSEQAVGELYQWYFQVNINSLSTKGWSTLGTELAIDGSKSTLTGMFVSKAGDNGNRQLVNFNEYADCVNKPSEGGSSGMYVYGANTPWGDDIRHAGFCNSSYEHHDGSLIGFVMYNFDKLEDCREQEVGGWQESDCIDQFKADFNISVGDTIYMDWLLPLMKNSKAAAQKELDPTFTYDPPSMNNVAAGHFIDPFDSDCLVGLSNCRENTPFTTFCPTELAAISSINIDDCGGDVAHTFNVVNPTPTGWFGSEYRPYFTLEDIRVPIYAPTMYCGNAVLTTKSGTQYPLVVKEYENHNCATVAGQEYCSVSSGNIGYLTFDLEDNGYPGLGVGLNGFVDEFTITYDLCKLCPSPIVGLSDYQIEYDYRTCDVPNAACYICNQNTTGTSNEFPQVCDNDDPTKVGRGQSYFSAFDLQYLYRSDNVIAEDAPTTDSSNGFGPLTQQQEKNLISSGTTSVSEETNKYTICADNTDPTKELHQGVQASVVLSNSITLTNVYDSDGNPLLATDITLVSSSSETSTYTFTLPNLDTPGVVQCTEFTIGTTLLYCPEAPTTADVCVTVSSGCMDPEIQAALLGGSSGCNNIQTCYQYVTEEAGIQAEFISPSEGQSYPLCEAIPVAVLIKNVKIATVTDLEIDIDIPIVGATIDMSSFMASYPNTGDLNGTFYPIDPPVITGNNLYFENDGVGNDFSSEIYQNGFPGVAAPDDENFIVVKFDIITDCDEFVSGSTATMNASASDPCSPGRLNSGVVNSNQLVIDGANPENYAQILVTANPSEAFCGSETPTFVVTGQNISEVASGDSVLMCITLPANLSYRAGSMRYVIPSGLTVDSETVTTDVNGITQVCFQGYENMPVGGAFTLNYEADFNIDTPCGDYRVGVDIKELIEEQACATDPTGACDVYVQSSVNPYFTLTLKAPMDATNVTLYRTCTSGPDPVEVCYTLELLNYGPQYDGDITVNLHDDLTANEILDDFDPILGTNVHTGLSVVSDGTTTLTACFDVNEINSCPVLLNVIYDTPCSCNTTAITIDEVIPDFLADIPATSVLCPGQEVELTTCSGYDITYDPADNVSLRVVGESTFVSMVDPAVLTTINIAGSTGECSTDEVRFLRGVVDFEIALDNDQACANQDLTLGLTIPLEYQDYVTIEWSPTTNIDDPTRIDPIFNADTPGDYTYGITLTFNDGCQLQDDVTVTVQSTGDIAIGGDAFTCEYPLPITLASDAGYDYYEWFEVLPNGFEIIKALTTTNSYTAVLTPGNYIVKGYRNTNLCPDVSAQWNIQYKECVDLELEKTICDIDATPNINDNIKYCLTVCNILNPDMGLVYTANDIYVGDELPAQVTYTGNYAVTGTGSYVAPTGTLYTPGTPLGWNVGTLAAGDCATLEIEVTLTDYGTINNTAEITNSDQDDIDSEEDNDDGDQSEDDEDNEEFTLEPFDLALIKEICADQTPLPPSLNDMIKYCLTVTNQGGVDAYNVVLTDYYPLEITPVMPQAGWTSDGAGTATYNSIPLVKAGESVTVEFLTTITSVPNLNAVNFGEITSAEDADGDNPVDIDSTPDADNTNDGDFVDNSITDPDDEDDHDPAIFYIPIVDLALNKTTTQVGPIVVGEDIVYNIQVCNQGNVPSTNIVINDHIPGGLELNTEASTGWTLAGSVATYIIGADDLAATGGVLGRFECISIPITTTVLAGANPSNLRNIVEINSFEDDGGFDITDLDIDSDGDDDPTNDGDMVDNAMDNENGDEDDSDFEDLEVFDLALAKSTSTAGPYSYGQVITFDIEIINQGNITADNIEISEYIPCGFRYLPVNDAIWSYDVATGIATTTITTDLLAATYTTVSIQVEVQACAEAGAYTNTAEISGATDENGDIVTDIDSTPDNDPDNDGPSEDNDIDNTNGDQDDHDPETIQVFDLALKKEIVEQGPFEYGDALTFNISVVNQGNVNATNVTIYEHLPAGFIFDAAANTAWDASNAPIYSYTITALNALATEVIPMYVTLAETSGGADAYTNIAEIGDAYDEDGDLQTDADSTGDDDPDNDNGGEPDGDTDNQLDGDGTDDEDDHDPAIVDVFDLALAKTTSTAGPYTYGQAVTFDIEITNQGNITADNIEISEYIPCGYQYLAVNDAIWSYDEATGIATTTITTDLIAGTSTIVSIQVELQSCEETGAYTNTAEISSATDDEGDPVTDIDSTPDDDPDNDGPSEDNDIDNTNGDEDDHDPETIEVFDLALKKETVEQGPFEYGDALTFNISVVNQGNVNATNITIYEHLPAGFIFDDSANTGWDATNAPTYKYNIEMLNALTTDVIPMYVTLTQTSGGADAYTNIAEIGEAYDEDDDLQIDADSTGDDDPDNDNGGEPDGDTDNQLDGDGTDDEDDHDPEIVDIFDLALVKRISNIDAMQGFTFGDIIMYELVVYNQGNIPATNIELFDHIPVGYNYDPTLNPGWSGTGPTPTTVSYTITDVVQPGEEYIVEIHLEIVQIDNGNFVENYQNIAEIGTATDDENNPQDDIDSDGDDDPDNDGDPVDDDTDNTDGDEDDHDPALPPFMDLALRKTLAQEYENIQVGDDVIFEVTVFNQGTIPAFNIEVTEYIPAGLSLSANDTNAWDDTDPSKLTKVIAGPLEPSDSTKLYVTVTVGAFSTLDDYINIAEVSSFEDMDGNMPNDFDSTPDNDPDNDVGAEFNEDSDDHIYDDGTDADGDGILDEDDHDIEAIRIFDLALKKTTNQVLPVLVGDDVEFDITVYNQGNITAQNVTVTDYIPTGFLLSDNDTNGWSSVNDRNAQIKIDQIDILDSVVVQVVLTVQPGANLESLTNVAEISEAFDTFGNDKSEDDVDSTTDDEPDNDEGGELDTDDDDNVDGNANLGEDEDDQDPARPPVFDLALIKYRLSDVPVIPGDIRTHEFKIFNQGNITAQNIMINDYLPSGTILSPTDTNGWTAVNDSLVTNVIPGPLVEGDSVTIQIDVEILVGAHIPTLINAGEINEVSDGDGNDMTPYDIDSNPDDDESNDVGGEADTASDNMINDDGTDTDGDGVMDEDDQDPAALPVFDLALTKMVPLVPVQLNDVVEFTFEICNQGTEDAANILVTDYIPTGLSFVTDGSNALWDDTDPLNPTFLYTDVIVSQTCGQFSIFLEVIDATPLNLINMGEITAAEDSSGNDRTGLDIDSVNDNINDDVGSEPYSEFDDVNDQDGRAGEDEDDHDQAWLLVCNEIVCSGDINLGLDENCSTTFTPAMILSPKIYPDYIYEVEITDMDGNIRPDGTFTSADIGDMFFISVSVPLCDNNSCWAKVTVEDKFAPVIDCPEDMTISCAGLDAVPEPSVMENCGTYELILLNETIDDLGGCDDDFIKKVTRTYKAIDAEGNESEECTFDIFLERIDLADVIFPPLNFQAQLGTAFECGGSYALDANGNPAPTETGIPTFQGFDLLPDAPMTFCNGFVSYEDSDLGTVGCVRTISRVWTVGEWHCGGDMTRMGAQLIQIEDTTGPTITCPTDMTVSTNNGVNNCEAMVTLPSITATDDCNMPVEVDIIYPGGFIDNQNGGLAILPTGTNTVTYVVYDGCYNSTSCSMTVTVQDENQPIALCTSNTVVAINSAGIGVLKAIEVDNGSFDDCGIDRYEIQRMTDNCGNPDDLILGEDVTFCCADVGTEQMVLFRVYDESGNYNECMVSVEIQNKQLPTLTCPADITVGCTTVFDFANLDLAFGAATTTGNCSAIGLTQSYVDDRNTCGIGVITRTFSVSDGQGGTITCDQRVVFNNPDPYTGPTAADWPVDVTFNNDVCNLFDLQPDNLPAGMNRPVIVEDNCDQVAVTFEDEVFTFTPGEDACYKVLRTWTVIDWCSRNADGTIPQYVHEQVLKVTNSIAPTITSSTADVVVETFDAACAARDIDLILTATDDCTETSNLNISYTIDLDSNGSIDLTGNTNNASGNYDIGIHTISWSVLDGCGNITTSDYTFEIRNAKSPQPICIQGLATELVPMDLDNDGTPDTEMVMLQPAMFDAGSNHPCGYAVTLSFSADVTDTEKVFGCDDLGQQAIELWVTDINGNQDFCATFIDVQDNNDVNICTPATNLANVTGQISTKEAQPISGTSVDLEDGAATLVDMTEDTGLYAFNSMPLGGSYEIVPTKNDDPLNGVSTLDLVLIQKHILGITPLDDGYDRLAADINNSENISAIDLIELRKLILGVYEGFPSNTSWRFIDKLHEFADGNDPWDGGFPETYNIDTLSGSMLIDFVGVKIGDVNGTVVTSLNDNMTAESRSDNHLVLQIDNRNVSPTASTMRVPLMSTNFKEIEGMQFTLELTDGLELVGLEGASIAMNESHIQFDESLSTKEKNVYRLSWNDAKGRVVNVDREIPICFMMISTIDSNTKIARQLSESMAITSTSTRSEYYKSSKVEGEVVVTFRNEIEDLKTLEAAAMPFTLYQNEPNPWIDMTTIGFDLPKEGNVSFIVKDMQGRVLLANKANYTAGHHEIQLSQDQVNVTSGLLILELIYGEEVQTLQMIKLR